MSVSVAQPDMQALHVHDHGTIVSAAKPDVISGQSESAIRSAKATVSKLFCFQPHGRVNIDLQRSMSLSAIPSSLFKQPVQQPHTKSNSLSALELDKIQDQKIISSDHVSITVAEEPATRDYKLPQSIAEISRVTPPGGTAELPFDVLARVLELCDPQDLKAAHIVSKEWSHAARLNVQQLAPSSLDPIKLAAFPKVQSVWVEHQVFGEDDFSSLQQLKELGLKKCQFRQSFDKIASFKDLEKLKLRDVTYGEADGADFCRLVPTLSQLTHLELARSSEKLYCLPEFELSHLIHLKEFVLDDHGIGSRFRHIGQLSQLTSLLKLVIKESVVDQDIAISLGQLTQLNHLELPDICYFNDNCMQQFSGLTNLTHLDLRTLPDGRADLLTRSMSTVSRMTKLEYLNLAGNVNAALLGIDYLRHLKSLKFLSLSGIDLGRQQNGPTECLSGLTGLTTLSLFATMLKGDQFDFLAEMPQLKVLETSHTYLDQRATPHIAKMDQLQTLRVNYCPLTNDGFEDIVHNCPSLTYLRTDGCWISALTLYKAMRRRPKIVFWSKSDAKNESVPHPVWYRKLETICSARVQPDNYRLRCFWTRERSWPATILVSMLLCTFSVLWMMLWLFALLVLSVVPTFAVMIFGLVAVPIIFFRRLLSGAYRTAHRAIPDTFEWLFYKLFPREPRTARDRLAELV